MNGMRVLGAILAGGASRRFGSDKASALLAGRPLLDHVADALRPQVDALVVCGRSWDGLETVADQPEAGLGPLGGLCGALGHALAGGFDVVLTAGCDVLPIPPDLAERLAPAPAVVAGQRLLGLWPAALAPRLAQHIATVPGRALRGWIAAAGAREVVFDTAFHNINTPDVLAACAAAPGRAGSAGPRRE